MEVDAAVMVAQAQRHGVGGAAQSGDVAWGEVARRHGNPHPRPRHARWLATEPDLKIVPFGDCPDRGRCGALEDLDGVFFVRHLYLQFVWSGRVCRATLGLEAKPALDQIGLHTRFRKFSPEAAL